MDKVTVRRWRRHGHDRIYVTGADGRRLGWHDVLTGKVHVDYQVDEPAVTAAVSTWLRDHAEVRGVLASPVAPLEVTDPDPVTQAASCAPQVPPSEHEGDLAQRAPGAAAREQARAARKAAPVRTTVARLFGVHTDERAWRIGADGEEKVGALLTRLSRKDPRWHAVHAIPVGSRGSDIDHLIIGPGGIYSINTKNHPGANVWVFGDSMKINGTLQHYIRNSRHEADRASRLLSTACGFPVPVTGLIVAVGVAKLDIKRSPGDVHILHRRGLTDWLRGRGPVLEPGIVEAIHAAARRPATWQQAAATRARGAADLAR
jgi:hypothetical protein